MASYWAGGANKRACVCDSSALILCSYDESSHISEGTNCYATELSC